MPKFSCYIDDSMELEHENNVLRAVLSHSFPNNPPPNQYSRGDERIDIFAGRVLPVRKQGISAGGMGC